MGGNRLSSALSLICSACGRAADDFEVIIRQELVVWPVPKDFIAPKRPPRRQKRGQIDEEPLPYELYLPLRIKKRLLQGIW